MPVYVDPKTGKLYKVNKEKENQFLNSHPGAYVYGNQPSQKVQGQPKDKPWNEFQRNFAKAKTEGMAYQINTTVNSNLPTPKLKLSSSPELKYVYVPKKGIQTVYEDNRGNYHSTFIGASMSDARHRAEFDNSFRGRLMRAYKELEDLEGKAKQYEENDSKKIIEDLRTFSLRDLAAGAKGPVAEIDATLGKIYGNMSDELKAYNTAINLKKEEIARLEDAVRSENGSDVGFWRGTFSNLNLRDFDPTSSFRMWSSLSDANSKLEDNAVVNKEPYQAVMQAYASNEMAKSDYKGNWRYRAGEMFAESMPFMADMFTSGMLGMTTSVGTRASINLATKATTKAFGKEVTEKIAKEGFVSFIKSDGWKKGIGAFAVDKSIKFFGSTADDIANGAILATTIQSQKTAAHIIQNKLGEITADDDGNLKFEDNKSWGSAIWQGSADQIVENLSEMSGKYFASPFSVKTAKGLAEAFNAKKISEWLVKADKSGFVNGWRVVDGVLKKMGIHGIAEEIGEEYYGQLWRTGLNLESAYDENGQNLFLNKDFHKEIWGGIALSVGVVKCIQTPAAGVSYVSLKHGVNKADKRAAALFSSDLWEATRAVIDGATNENMGEIVYRINIDKDLSPDQKAAATEYAGRLLELRGFNLASAKQEKNGLDAAADASYVEGYNAVTEAQMKAASIAYDKAFEELSENFDEQSVNYMKEMPLETLIATMNDGLLGEEEMAILVNFVNAQERYNGMVQRVKDDIDEMIEESNAKIDSSIYRETNTIQPAIMKQDGRRVNIIAGVIEANEDGSINKEKTGDVILIRDEATGELEQVSPDAILNIEAAVNPAEAKAIAAEAIRLTHAAEAENKVEGVVPGVQVVVPTENGNVNATISSVADGVVSLTSENGEIFTMERDAVADAIAEAERVERQIARERLSGQMQAEEHQGTEIPIYDREDEFQATDENGDVFNVLVTERNADGYALNIEDTNGTILSAPFYTKEQMAEMFPAEDYTTPTQEQAPVDDVVQDDTLGQQAVEQTEVSEAQQKPTYTRDGKTRTAYHLMPVADTIGELFAMGMDAAEIDSVAQANIKEAEKDAKSHEKKQPKQKTDFADPDEFIASKQKWQVEMQEWQAEMDDINARLAYWEGVQAELDKVAHTEMETESVVSNEVVETPESYIANYLGGTNGVKITPESFKAETGFGAEEQKKMVGAIAKKENGGVSIERAAEIILESGGLQELGFQGDVNDVRNIIIDILSEGNPRSYAKRQAQEAYDREREAELAYEENQKQAFAEELGFESYDDYLAYEEIALPVALSRYSGFNESEYYSNLADKYYQTENEYEQQRIDSEPEVAGTIGSGEVLQGEQPISTERTEDINIEQQGGTVQAGMQGGIEDATASEEVGPFGVIYRQFKGKAKEAVAFLLNKKSGEAVGALHHPEIGDIDLVWGEEGTGHSDGFGLAKLAKYHPEVLDNLQEILNDMHVTKRSDNRVQLESDTHQAAVRLTWDNKNKNWLLTAFEKKNSVSDNTTDTGETSDRGKRNDTATPQNTVSDGKATELVADEQAKDVKNEELAPIEESIEQSVGIGQNTPTIGEQVQAAEAEVNTNPTEAQKEAGNYKKGHVQIGTFNVTIEQPKGSVRSGVDKGGKKWEVEMQNTYGYIRGTEGVDGDHIDVFLSDDIDGWDGHKVFVVDQRNADGSFDEHKVMLGFNDINDAEAAYMSNYEEGWQGLGAITGVSIEEFEKWITSSHRKTKAFAEYKSVKTTEGQSASAERRNLADFKESDVVRDYYNQKLYRIKKHSTNGVSTIAELDAEGNEVGTTTMNAHNNSRYSLAEAPVKAETPTISQESEQVSDQDNAPYAIAPAQYTTKKGKVLDMHLVKFAGTLTKEQQRAAKELAKAEKGWYDREQGGFMMRSEESAKQLADTILGNEEAVSEAQPVSMTDIQALNNGDVLFTEPQQVEQTDSEDKSPVWQYSIHVDKETGRTTLRRDDVSGVYPIGDARWQHTAASPEEMLDILRNPLNGMQDVLEAVGVTLENKIKTRELDLKSKEQAPTAETNPSGNRLVTDERYAELRERMRKKLGGQMNIGIDPEILAIGTEMAVYHLEKGARKFTEFAKAMVADLGDVIRPYLKAFYNGARNLPEVESSDIATDMTSYDEVQTFDIANFDKPGIDAIATAETVTREAEVAQEVEVAQERIKKTRSAKKETKKKAVNLQQSGELGLFDSLFDNETNNEDGLQRNDAIRSEGVSANGNRHEQGLSRGTETSSESEQQDSRGTDLGGERTGDAVDRTVRPRLSDTVTEPKNTRNNHSERGKDHAPTSVDARIEANIKAIELAKQLLESGEQATEKQMQTLRKFSGWGGLGKAFSEGTYYAPNNIAKRLRELLGEAAYQEAVMSANSAYYTPAYVVDTLWDIAEQMGFKGGNILEGSAGIGNILGQMPTHISERSNIHAIEIDGTSGGILSLLYPDAKVEIQGFEQTRIANGSVDLAITNVPFVTGLRVNDTTGDKDLSKKFHNIHDFCIAKNVRKLREGGLGIFITSNGTLDNSKKLRDWIVNEGGADFVGAFRMHNKTFGGTGVTSDIIVIRKRVNGKKSANAIDVSTVTGERMAEYDTGETRKVKGQIVPVVKQLSMDYNQYFVEHPENMAGEMHFAFEKGDTFRPTSKGLYPKQDKKQEQMLAEFVQSFTAEEAERLGAHIDTGVTDVMPGKKIGEVFVSDGKLYINAIGAAQPLEVNANKVKGHTKVECFEAYSAIKEALAAVLEYQITHEDDKGLKPLLAKLNKAYDDFVATYGHFNKNTAIAFLRNDVDYANVASVETYEEIGDGKGGTKQTFGKADVMKKRVVEKEKEPAPTNVKDGIVASIFKYGRIDVPYIAEHLNKSAEEVKQEIIESGYGFEDPATRQVEVSYQYLSGNVREKLRQAQENNENGEFDRNIKALQEVMPMTIPAHLIDFTLGSSWIEPKLYEEYVKERTDVGVQFTAVGGTWFMNEPYYTAYEKNRAMGVTSEMLGRTVMGHTLIEAAIQNKSITVSTVKKNWDGSTETITDKEATQACSAKIDEIRQDFKEWARQKMQSDAEMSERMERVYNDTFNNYVPMSIPEEFVPEYFGGASHKFKMRSHQGRAIVRGTMQPLLLAHEVGTGKTFTLISTAMEMRRLGTARKPMIVVQNATVGQFVASAKELYPNAKILTLEEADRSADGRKNFYAKIKYNDWDMIVVPQSTFEFIPDSEERQMAFVQEKIEEKMLVLEQMKEADPDGKSIITRQAEREIALLEEELAGLSGETGKKRTANDEKKRAVALQNAEVKAMEMLDRRTDDVENFDDMGIDALLIDEAHEYKHLGFATAMQRGVKGVDPSYSKKSQGVFLKTQAVLEKNNGRNVIFATGTPISNTAAEIWTFMRYLMPADTMKEYGIYYFDDFVRNFGNIQQMLEFTTSGKFKENNRFAGYVNLPELVRIWSGVSDTVLTKEAGGVSDKIPDMEGGKAQDLYLPQTRALRSIMKYVKAELERYDQMSGKQKKENSHIPLTMYGIAKAAAVDARLVQSDAEDDTQSKTNEAVRQTLRSLKESADYKGTVAIFADNYQNKESGFNLYEDIRTKLIAEGIPADEIVVIKSGMTVKKKLEIFEKVNRGEIRVILGSTFTLGTGVNIQERLYTLIHLDAPNRPMDYTQRNGRILRQGNLHKAMGKAVRVLRFGVEDSLDVTAYQRLKTKGAIADSIMNGKQMMANSMTNRVLEEEEDVFGDTVAQLSGSEYAMLKNNAEKNVRKYASRKKQWEADQTYIHNAKPRVKAFIKDAEKRIDDNSRYLEAVRASFPDGKFKEIVIGKHRFATVEAMEDFFKEHNKSILAEMKQMKDGEIAGEQKRELTIQIGDFSFVVTTKLTRQTMRDGATLFNDVERKMTYSCAALGIEDIPVRQNLLRNAIEDITNNVITGKDFAEHVEIAERVKKHNETELEQLLSREGKPFEYEAELEQAQTQYEEFSELMKKELAEKEAKYAEMDATVEAANDLATAEEADELEREGVGSYTDDALSDANDLIQKATGNRRYSPKQRREYAIRLRKNMAAYAYELANRLGLDNVEEVMDASQLEGKKQRAKGFYSKSTGKITIVIPNHKDTYDIEQTVLHEAVAHYGLRKLFGPHFDTFLDNVFRNASVEVRQNISRLAANNGWDIRKATEEYLARLAEDTYFEAAERSGWWAKLKGLFIKMLTEAGVRLGFDLSDNELRYILWRSYQNLAQPGRFRSVFEEAEDISKQSELGVGNYAESPTDETIAAEDDLLMRDGGMDELVKYANTLSNIHAWSKSHKGATKKVVVVPSESSLRKQLDKAGFADHVIDKAEKSMQEGTIAAYYPYYDTIVVYNPHADILEINGYLWHENAHKAIEQIFTKEEIEILFKAVAGAKEHEARALFSGAYEEEEIAEEFLVTMLEQVYLAHPTAVENNKLVGSVGEYNMEIGVDVFAPIINLIKNGNKEEARRDANSRLGRRGLQVAQESEEVAVRNSESASRDAQVRRKTGALNFTTREKAIARDRYERRVKSGMYQSLEATQDSMLGLKVAMDEILGDGRYIEDVAGFENAYLGENRLSSVNKAEADAFAHTLFKPMLDAVAKLAKNDTQREELTDYMFAKHGLERNKVMAEADAQKAYDKHKAVHPNTKKTLQDFIDKFREKDYAGLTALTGYEDVADAENEAQRMVDDYELNHDTDEMWQRINDVSNAILEKLRDGGLMDRETFDKVSSMYEYYIPLRGFDEKTSSEAYAYLTSKNSAFNAPIKKAEGRRSKADDPLSNLEAMAESAIMQSNRNKLVKQRFLNFVTNHPSDLVSVSDIWIKYDEVNDEWVPVFPNDIEATDTPEEVEQKMQDFEERMRELAEQNPDNYKRGKDAVGIPYRVVTKNDLHEHQVVVKRGGRDYVITINGNPRAAQALNGQTNPDNDMSGAIGAILRAGEKVNRQLSAFYTTRNPDFIVSNFVRDMLYTNRMVWIKESPNYALRFHRNYLMVNPVTMKRLLAKHRKGTLDMSNKTEAMFHQFMMNGGETGYANIRDIEQHKNDIRKELKRANGKLKLARAWSLLAEKFDELNRAVENCARFAAFVTSREMGRSIDRAIYDAKEISVNFNKKGSGAKFYGATGQTTAGNASALVSGLGRSGYVFWNAAIQGTTNFGRQVKRHPAKAFTRMAAMFLLGAIVAYLGGDDDEDDKNAYYNLPENVRRSNILFRAGDSWISIPLPIEYRAFYGMGELMTSVLSGKEHLTGGEIAEAVLGQATQILPIDFLEGGGGLNAFVPSAAKPLWEAYVTEKSWTGMPLYKDTPFNKDMPEWTKAYKSANKHIVNLAAVLNDATGGDPYTKGAIDINPAKVEYMLNGYFGGVFRTIDKLTKTAETIVGEREYDPRSILLVNQLVKAGDERTEYRAVNNEYFRLKEEHDRLGTRLRHYEEDTDNGIFDYAEKIDFLYNSPEYERYEIFEDYRRDIDDLYEEMKEAVDDEERKDIEAELNALKKELVEEANETRK